MALRLGKFHTSSASSSSGANCLEIGIFKKSSASGSGSVNCVEATIHTTTLPNGDTTSSNVLTANDVLMRVRDSKVSKLIGNAAAALTFSLADWEDPIIHSEKGCQALTTAAGKAIITFALRDGNTFAQVPMGDGGAYWTKSDQPHVIHEFTKSELAAWRIGVLKGEFDPPPQITA